MTATGPAIIPVAYVSLHIDANEMSPPALARLGSGRRRLLVLSEGRKFVRVFSPFTLDHALVPLGFYRAAFVEVVACDWRAMRRRLADKRRLYKRLGENYPERTLDNLIRGLSHK